MNPLSIAEKETFRSGSNNLEFFHDHYVKLTNGGSLMYCIEGEADITIDLQEYHIVPHTHIVLLPNTVLSLSSASKDFKIRYFAFSAEMMKMACMRLKPAFIRFLKEYSCQTHSKPEAIKSILGLVEASVAIYDDKENLFRDSIAQNLLQIFFLNTYDKIQRFADKEILEENNRKGQLFKKFIYLIQMNCTTQRDVAFYAEKLCISTRYLSAIAQAIGKKSAKEIIDEFLMLEIKVALQSTTLSLKEIAEHYRFPDQSFFGRYFKKHTGMSPKEYRNNLS